MAKIYYDSDASLEPLWGKRVAVIGYGSQGRAQALNIRDSGIETVVGLRGEGRSFDTAVRDGFTPIPIDEAVRTSDVILMLIPDVPMPITYREYVESNLTPGKTLVFAHGYNIHFKRITPPPYVDVVLVAPKGPGPLVRQKYLEGRGVPSLIAVHQDASGHAKGMALAIAKAIGAARAGVIETTFQEETETDLLGEQAVLVGGVMELIKKGFDVLVENGYQPELAYYEVCNELKLIVDLIYSGGLMHMLRSVSDTAKFGGLVVGPQIIDETVKQKMQEALKRIKSGEFEKQWTGDPNAYRILEELMRRTEQHQLENVGKRLREMALI
ncbi:MAG: ketol-acid reductoisomerase [Nitrososphaerota archaeon]|nr:ketol-acid reductoisomerase [Candidatus Calditenuaceae archaeon]MDW8073316.1 ketol-acid reductoisomerase [Nitrososphaerota archaeon]